MSGRARPGGADAADVEATALRKAPLREHQPENSPTTATRSSEGDPVLLIVEDDPHYARVLLGLAHDKDFKGMVAQRGSVALSLAREYLPTAIRLDIFLPDNVVVAGRSAALRDGAHEPAPGTVAAQHA